MSEALVFLGTTADNANQLFEVDALGTVQPVDLGPAYPQPGSDGALGPTFLTAFAGGLEFSGGSEGVAQLWTVDLDLDNASDISQALSTDLEPRDLAVCNGMLFFAGLDADGNGNLYASDGSAAGTAALLVTGVGPQGLAPDWIVSQGGQLYFSGIDSSGSTDLWVSDGTAAGTHAVAVAGANTQEVFGSGTGLVPTQLTAALGKVFFFGNDDAGNAGLWVSDGTPAGTLELAAGAVTDSASANMVAFGGRLYFAGMDSAGSVGLWSTDGTTSGTVELAVTGAGSAGLDPVSLTVFDGALYFGGTDANGMAGLWRSDGTAAGTVELAVAGVGPGGLDPVAVGASDSPNVAMTALGGKLYFAGIGADGLSDLWQSDGTAAGTVEVTVPGALGTGLGLDPTDFALVDTPPMPGTATPVTAGPGTPSQDGPTTGSVASGPASGSSGSTPPPAGGTAIDATPSAPGLGTTVGGATASPPAASGAVILAPPTASATIDSTGTDTIYASSGNDLVFASGPAATVLGGTGNLVFVAGGGAYTAGGGSGSDTLYGGSGADVFTGGNGSGNVLVAGFGNTTLLGGAGNADLMFGGQASTTFTGSVGGNDTMVGGAGTNVFNLTTGAIAFGGPNGPSDTFNTGNGSVLVVEGPAATQMNFGGGSLTAFGDGSGGPDTYSFTKGLGGSAEIVGFKVSDQLTLTGGFTEADVAAALSGATTDAAGTALTLSDGTRIELFGASVTAAQFGVG